MNREGLGGTVNEADGDDGTHSHLLVWLLYRSI